MQDTTEVSKINNHSKVGVMFFERSLLCTPRQHLHLFDQK